MGITRISLVGILPGYPDIPEEFHSYYLTMARLDIVTEEMEKYGYLKEILEMDGCSTVSTKNEFKRLISTTVLGWE